MEKLLENAYKLAKKEEKAYLSEYSYKLGYKQALIGLGEKISEIINQDVDEKSDGECMDEMVEYLRKLGIWKEKEE